VVAVAALRALEELLREGATLELEAVHVHRAEGEPIVLVRLTLQDGPALHDLTGSAAVRGDESDAVVRAVLDAANRRIEALLA
jgi:hypothetical protein